jgi:outer membrane protein assembly factor BamB
MGLGMEDTRKRTHPSFWCALVAITVSVVGSLLLFASQTFGRPQIGAAPGPLVTPSSAVLLVGEPLALTAVDESGKPVSSVQWSISPAIAELRQQNGEVIVEGKQEGRAVLTGTVSNQTATAIISIIQGEKLPPGTVRWSLQPLAGFQTLLVVQAMPTEGGPVFFSVEWSKTSNAIVRALTESGQQLWSTQLASSASPLTLKNTLPAPGQVFQNEALVSDHSMFIIGQKGGFAGNNATDPTSYGLPPDGKSILVHATGDYSGSMIFLERGRFRDSLVDLNPADGSELWRYRSEGRLAKNWTANGNEDVGIVEVLTKPASSALLILNAKTGKIRSRIPFPISSSTMDGYRCKDPERNILKSLRPSPAGSVFTSNDSNVYVQVETHVESVVLEGCTNKQYSFDDTLALLRVTPAGETEWKTLQHIHADGAGSMVAQPRMFAGETIPDGFGGALAAWTFVSPDTSGGQIRSEARLSRVGPSGQQDFTLPMPYWSKGLNSLFAANMILGEGNFLYAINGPLLLRFDTQAGEVNWVRHPPTGEVKLDHSTVGGGLLISNAGRLVYFDPQGNGVGIPWTVAVSNPEDIGLVQRDLLEHTAMAPLQLREANFTWAGEFIGVEDGVPYGHGALVSFMAQ